jgi:hypothetical protein
MEGLRSLHFGLFQVFGTRDRYLDYAKRQHVRVSNHLFRNGLVHDIVAGPLLRRLGQGIRLRSISGATGAASYIADPR